MNLRSLDIIKEAYKPLKVTILGNVQVLESTSGTIVLKEKKDQNIRELYDYLKSRGFSYFPDLIDDSREGINIYSYVKDSKMPKEQKAMDFIKIIALLHQKTTYYKDVSQDEYKKIYENVNAQIEYLLYYYEDIYHHYFQEVYPSPSQYLLLSNVSKILASLQFSKKELEVWWEKTSKLSRFRVCQIHNNLNLDHFRKCDKECILSWDYSRRDSPVVDLVSFYKSMYFDLNFESYLEEYFRICPWSDEEKKLFFIVLSIPPKFEEKNSEFVRCKNVRAVLDYVYKTEQLIRPYYSVEQE